MSRSSILLLNVVIRFISEMAIFYRQIYDTRLSFSMICISVIHTLNGEGLLLLYQFRSNLEFRLPFFAGI